jgi:Leucine-rich repeat (LRR) protein
MEDLRLNFNRIAYVSPFTFNNLTNLSNLDLYWNEIESLDRDLFAGKLQIKKLDSGVNRLKSLVNASTLGLFSQLKYLEKLSFRNNNQIDYINASVFKGLDSLKDLNLLNNNLNMLDDKWTFANLTQLENIDLRYNNLTSIHVDIFIGLKNLKYVQLEFNPIAFTNLTYVCSLCSTNDKCIIFAGSFRRCERTSSSDQMKYSRLSLILIVFTFLLY